MYSTESSIAYGAALSLGKKKYQRSKAQGRSGHLPALDGLLKDIDIISTVSLGTMSIPLKKIKGTYSNGRRMTFAKNFMPLEGKDTEFSQKWMALCDAHLNEGIRDPIKVYEYMNFYYVVEGNKRVSVLKYYEAISIEARVTRLVPRFDEENDLHQIYFAFLPFYKETGIHQIWFSKKGRFDRLLRYLETYEPPEGKAKYVHFYRFIYEPFRSIYLSNGGLDLPVTTGDAYLLFARFHGVMEHSEDLIKETMPRLLKELTAYDDPEAVDISTDGEVKTSTSLITPINLLLSPFKRLKVAFIYARTIEKSGWTYSHELGRRHIEKVFGSQVTTTFVESVPEDENAFDVIEAYAKEAYDVIFTTSEVFMKATMRCAMAYPSVKFFNCSENRPYVHMSNYFGRTYEPRFITGLIAGAMSQTGIIGYTATKPSSEVISGINAFTLGARMMNPRAKVVVAWTHAWNHPEKSMDTSLELARRGADLVNNKTLEVPRKETWDYGINSMLCSIDQSTLKPTSYLASPIWRWGVFYEKIVTSILNGTYKAVTNLYNDHPKLINYWWGLASGVLDVYINKTILPTETVKMVEHMKRMIIQDAFHPFTGPLFDQSGNQVLAKGIELSPEEILTMDWYIEGVDAMPYHDPESQ